MIAKTACATGLKNVYVYEVFGWVCIKSGGPGCCISELWPLVTPMNAGIHKAHQLVDCISPTRLS